MNLKYVCKYSEISYSGKFAREFLAMPIKIVAQVFTLGNRVMDQFGSCRGAKTAQKLLCAQNWLWNEFEGNSDECSFYYNFLIFFFMFNGL